MKKKGFLGADNARARPPAGGRLYHVHGCPGCFAVYQCVDEQCPVYRDGLARKEWQRCPDCQPLSVDKWR